MKRNNEIIRVMSFNIRNDNPGDKENSWVYRKEMASSIIRFHGADIFGVQEANRKYVLDEFIAALIEKRPGETDLDDNLKTYEITQAAIESIEKQLRIIIRRGE